MKREKKRFVATTENEYKPNKMEDFLIFLVSIKLLL